MNYFAIILDGFVKIFFTRDGFLKNICLFLLIGFLSIFTTKYQIFADQFDKTQNFDWHSGIAVMLLYLLANIIIGAFLNGYYLKFIHNLFNKESEAVMPDVDFSPVKWFFKAFPLYLSWIGTMILVGIVASLLLSWIPFINIISYIAFMIIALLISAGTQFMIIKFAKTQSRTGLYNVFDALQYIKGDIIGPMFIFGILFMLLYICVAIPIFITGLAADLISSSDTSVKIFVTETIGGYLFYILQILWGYCLVQIYKENIDLPNDENYNYMEM